MCVCTCILFFDSIFISVKLRTTDKEITDSELEEIYSQDNINKVMGKLIR